MKNLTLRTKFVLASLASMLALPALAQEGGAISQITTGIAQVQADALEVQSLMWPAVIAVTIGFILFKIFKKGANKVG